MINKVVEVDISDGPILTAYDWASDKINCNATPSNLFKLGKFPN